MIFRKDVLCNDSVLIALMSKLVKKSRPLMEIPPHPPYESPRFREEDMQGLPPRHSAQWQAEDGASHRLQKSEA